MGIIYQTEYNRVPRQHDLENTSLKDAVRRAGGDLRMQIYDTVSLTLENGMVINHDEIMRLTTSKVYQISNDPYDGFRANLSVPEDDIIDHVTRMRQEKERQRIQEAERQQKRRQAEEAMRNRVKWFRARSYTEHLSAMSFIENDRKLWAILHTTTENGEKWEIFIEGRLQPPVGSEEHAVETMISYITGEYERYR